MQFLSTESQASLSALGDIVDRKMSKLRSNSEIETTRFRQAVYLTFIKRHHIQDPCGSKPGYQRVVACFMEQLMLDHNSRSPQSVGTSRLSIFCSCFGILNSPLTYPTAQTCAHKFSLIERRKNVLHANAARSPGKYSAP